MIIVLDCGMGNTGSVINMLKKVGADAIASSNPDEIKKADKLILPGIGKFDYAMTRLKELGLIDLLNELVLNQKKEILGICLGMQLFSEKSEEGLLPGLGWIAANTVRFNFEQLNDKPRIPHMGWNSVIAPQNTPLLSSIDNEIRYYFVHSYHVVCHNKDNILGTTTYGYEFVSAVQKDNILGVQFHPEKSHIFGMSFLKAFIKGEYLA